MAEVVKLGRKGQVSIPAAMLERMGLQGESYLLVESSDDGAIVLRPAGVYPVEIYSEERLAEFAAENETSREEEARIRAVLARG